MLVSRDGVPKSVFITRRAHNIPGQQKCCAGKVSALGNVEAELLGKIGVRLD